MQIRWFITEMLAGLCFLLLLTSHAIAGDTPANVSGTWNVIVNGQAGRIEQIIELKQDGNIITGNFKGPRQSGPLEGSIEGNKIQFHVKTRVPIDYTGTVVGDTMKGSLAARGQSNGWTATRNK